MQGRTRAALADDLVDAAAQNPAVADAAQFQALAGVDHAVVMGDGRVDLGAEEAVARGVVARDRVFKNFDFGEGLLQLAQQGNGVGGVVQKGVPVGVDAEVIGRDGADLADGLADVEPRPGLDFYAGVAEGHCGLRLYGVSFRRHIVVPKRDGAPVAALGAQQLIERHAGQFAGNVEKGHL